MVARCRQLLVVALFVVLAQTSLAQDIGRIAALDNTVEIGRGGTWAAANIGNPVGVGDQVRTNATGRVRIVFRDGSVLNLGTATQMVIEQQTGDADKGVWHSGIQLLKGKLRSLVSEYYKQSGSVYEIGTPTAVAGVRGTEFVMTYDPAGDLSQVVGVTGTVAVHSVTDRRRRAVEVTTQELTIVARGKFPTPPKRIPDKLFREYIEDLQFIGDGRSESLTTGHALLAGSVVPPPDRPGPVLLQPHRHHLPGEPEGLENDPSAGGPAGQPLPFVQPNKGNVGINF
jgi:hypothetical protein